MRSNVQNSFFPALRFAVVTAFVAVAGGCQPVDAAFDCNTICTRYKQCFNGDYDVAACASRCRDRASKDSSVATAINRCEACISDRACASATFNCASDCNNVVP